MLSMIWMFVDDNDDDFKTYQRAFRKMEIKNSEDKLVIELEEVKNERAGYEEKLLAAQQSFDGRQDELTQTISSLEDRTAKFYKANMNFLGQKSIVDAEKYKYETAKLHYHGDEPLKIEKEYFALLDELQILKLKKEEQELAMLTAEEAINEIGREKKYAQDKLNQVLKEANLVDLKLTNLDRKRMSLANKIGDIVRDIPILDFLAPYYKIEQAVLPDIKYNVNFASVPEVDRCTSCHLGISNPDYIDAKQPYTTHPNLDLYLTSSSPHPFEEFGCTGCHNGRGRGTNFVSATHTPDNTEDKIAWEEDYDWHEMHHWLKPMLPAKYSEASCFKCHNDEVQIKGAEKLTLGLTLIEKNGCNGCHKIATYPSRRKAGPDLSRINEKVDKKWTGNWIKDPRSFRHNTKMPSFFNQTNNSDSESMKRNETEIATIVEYLFQGGKQKRIQNESKYRGNSENGKKLFNLVGCKGCHIIEPNPNNMPVNTTLVDVLKQQGPNLIGLGTKTTADWVFNWLKNPSNYWHETRMPNLRLSDDEAKDLTSYLLSFKNSEFEDKDEVLVDSTSLDDITLGWLGKMYPEKESISRFEKMDYDEKVLYVADKSIRYYGCYGCHNIPGYEDAKPIGTELTFEGSKPIDKLDFGFQHDLEHNNYTWFEAKLKNPRIFDKGKVVANEDKLRMPNFNLNSGESEAIVTAILSFTDDQVGENVLASKLVQDPQIFEGRKLIRDYNCQGCHIIDGFGGQIAENYSAPEYAPPNLNTQGAKVQPEWLFNFFKNPMIIRPNLQVRMPSFDMTDKEWNAVITAFQNWDDEFLAFESDFHVDQSTKHFKAGEKLHELGACNNCHFYGTKFPKQGAQTWAANLALTKDRLQPDWLIEWLRDPQVIMPGTKMPAPYLPDTELLNLPGSQGDWGKYVVEINGDKELMLEGLRDYIYSIKGKTDITKEIQEYFKKNGYNFEIDEDENEDDDW